jgi:hypothetical protein
MRNEYCAMAMCCSLGKIFLIHTGALVRCEVAEMNGTFNGACGCHDRRHTHIRLQIISNNFRMRLYSSAQLSSRSKP